LDSIENLAHRLGEHPELAGARVALSTTLGVAREATKWLATHSSNPVDLLAGATPYLRLISTLTGGFLLAESAIIAKEASAELGADMVADKVASARFFCEQLLPGVNGLLPSITGDSALLMSAL
ncbi:MAG: acyl-CoA dehydrogenase C-terminal domain-containing protein, partial [Actinomycetota bacterium]